MFQNFKPEGLNAIYIRNLGLVPADFSQSILLGNFSSSAAQTEWNLNNVVYMSKSFNPGQIGSAINCFHVSDTGEKLYIFSISNNSIYQYSLTTPYDISTAVFDSFFIGMGYNLDQFCITNNGRSMYVRRDPYTTISKYSLPTPYLLGGATYSSASPVVTGVDTGVYGIYSSSDESRIFFTGSENDKVYQLNVDPPGTISSGVIQASTIDLSALDNYPRSVVVSPDGTKIFVLGFDSSKVHGFTLATPFELSSYSYDGYYSITVSGANVGMDASSTGQYLYLCTTDTIHQFSMTP